LFLSIRAKSPIATNDPKEAIDTIGLTPMIEEAPARINATNPIPIIVSL